MVRPHLFYSAGVKSSWWTVCVLLVSGCTSVSTDGPDVVDEVLPDAAPVASHEDTSLDTVDWGISTDDVSAPARAVVSSYLRITDEIGARGGRESESIGEAVTPLWLPREVEGFEDYLNQSIRTLGQTRFDHFEVQSARKTASSELEVAVFLCVDSSKVLVIGANDVDPPESLRAWLDAPAGEAEPDQDTVDSWEPYLEDTGARTGFREPIVIWLIGESPNHLLVDGTENWHGANPC